MKKATEIEIKVPDLNGNTINLPNYRRAKRQIAIKERENKLKDKMFVLVEASKLSMDDKFMKFKPQPGSKEEEFKKLLTKVIKSGIKDFYRPKYDPSENGKEGIEFVADKKPAVDHSFLWWNRVAERFYPERNSRLGTKSEYVAFLGVLIKKLVAKGWTVKKAWNAVCSDSKELGHYWNSKNAKHDFENTGCREVCGFYDLGNTCKILAEDKEIRSFWNASGFFHYDSNFFPLSFFGRMYYHNNDLSSSVGWIVLEN